MSDCSDVSESSEDDVSENSHSSSSDASSDDEVIGNILQRQEMKSRNPKPILTKKLITDLCFHPDDCNKIAVGYFSGAVDFFEIGIDETIKLSSLKIHHDSCRGIDFLPKGKKMISVSIEGTMMKTDVEKGVASTMVSDPNILFWNVKVIGPEICATGDENGALYLWDMRSPNWLRKAKMSDEIVTCLRFCEGSNRIVCTTGGGELFVYDVRMPKQLKLEKEISPYCSEFTSCTLIRGERNIVCSTNEGDLLLFDWEPFDYQTYKPRVGSLEISSLISVSENIILAGFEDGKINAIFLYPHSNIGLVGKHNWDVNKLDINSDGSIIASSSNCIKFWDISYLEDVESITSGKKKKENDFPLPSSEIMTRKNFFSDLN